VDFEVESAAAGLDRVKLGAGPTFVSWLGVVHYLTADAIGATLRALPPCSLAVSYVSPEEMWDGEVRAASQTFQAMARDAGEPFVSLFTREEFAAVLADGGFAVIEDVGPEDAEERFGLPAVGVDNERIALVANDA
jgi:O-methyltransferase involved in polyketide biosynthesis